jgi:hypothetical protein
LQPNAQNTADGVRRGPNDVTILIRTSTVSIQIDIARQIGANYRKAANIKPKSISDGAIEAPWAPTQAVFATS